MARVAWVLTDPIEDETYSMPVNPHTDGGSFARSKSVAYESNAAFYESPDGGVQLNRAVVFHSGGKNESTFSFDGFTYSNAQILHLIYWVDKDYPVYLTDDLGRTFKIIFNGLTLSRSRSRNREKIAYKISGISLGEVEDFNG